MSSFSIKYKYFNLLPNNLCTESRKACFWLMFTIFCLLISVYLQQCTAEYLFGHIFILILIWPFLSRCHNSWSGRLNLYPSIKDSASRSTACESIPGVCSTCKMQSVQYIFCGKFLLIP